MTESSSSPSSVTTIISPRNDLDNVFTEVSPTLDIQSQVKLSTDTKIDSLPAVSNSFYRCHIASP
jgi:hypothetical protein